MERLNLGGLQSRFEELRTSPAFPAIVAAFAGGLVGGIMAARLGTKTRVIERMSEAKPEPRRQTVLLGFTPREMLELITVTGGLMTQLKAWRDETKSKQVVEDQTGVDLGS